VPHGMVIPKRHAVWAGALATVQAEPYGSALLAVVAAGLLAHGAFGIVEGIYRRIAPRRFNEAEKDLSEAIQHPDVERDGGVTDRLQFRPADFAQGQATFPGLSRPVSWRTSDVPLLAVLHASSLSALSDVIDFGQLFVRQFAIYPRSHWERNRCP
jgi:uncharacterized protein DUF1206